MLSDSDAVLVCDITESSFEVTTVRREDVAAAVGRALQHARRHGVVVLDVVLSGAASRERWLQQAAAEASGVDRVLALQRISGAGPVRLCFPAIRW